MKRLPLQNKHFESLHKDLGLFLTAKNYNSRTASMISACVREFLFFVEAKGLVTIQQVRSAEIIGYYEYIIERPNQNKEGGLSDSMIRHHLFSIRVFFDYLLDANEIKSSPAKIPKFQIAKKKERNICSIEEIKQLYDACQTKRERAILALAYGCGLRRSEISKLNTTDVLLHKGTLLVRSGKYSKSRTIPLSNSVIKDLKEYLIYERAKYFTQNNYEESSSFLINNIGKRMAGQKIGEHLKQIILRTNNNELLRKEITLHCLRHSIATHLLDKGANMEFVRDLLGHAEMDTAQLYSKRRKQRLNILHQIRQ